MKFDLSSLRLPVIISDNLITDHDFINYWSADTDLYVINLGELWFCILM